MFSQAQRLKVKPEEMQKYAQALIVDLLGNEKEEEYFSKILNFPHSKDVQSASKSVVSQLNIKLEKAQNILHAAFQKQDQAKQKFSQNASFSVWENVKKDLKNKIKDSHFLEKLVTEKSSLQAMENIPWDFMDRTYNVAVNLLKQGNFQDAECVFLFLRFLCPAVFEYWVGEATALQMQGQWEEAMNTYFVSLVFKPKNPLVFFQIATCCQKLELQDKFKNALDLCIEYAKSDVASRPIADLAKEMRKQVA